MRMSSIFRWLELLSFFPPELTSVTAWHCVFCCCVRASREWNPHKPIKCGICRIFLSTLLYWIILLTLMSIFRKFLGFFSPSSSSLVSHSWGWHDPTLKESRVFEYAKRKSYMFSSFISCVMFRCLGGMKKCQIARRRFPHTKKRCVKPKKEGRKKSYKTGEKLHHGESRLCERE